jgi:hypothetical protein
MKKLEFVYPKDELISIIKRFKITKKKAAEMMGVHRGRVSDWTDGRYHLFQKKWEKYRPLLLDGINKDLDKKAKEERETHKRIIDKIANESTILDVAKNQ